MQEEGYQPKEVNSSVTDLSSQGRDSPSHRQQQCNFSIFITSCFKTTFEVALGGFSPKGPGFGCSRKGKY